MSTQEKKLYKDITVKGNKRPIAPVASRAYRGISTTNFWKGERRVSQSGLRTRIKKSGLG